MILQINLIFTGRLATLGGGRGKEDKEWIPVTKLGRLVKDGKIKSLEEIYLYSLPIKVFCLMSQSLKNHDPHFSYR